MADDYTEIPEFTGETIYKVDGKGRIIVPIKGESFIYLLIGVAQKVEERCLLCMTPGEFGRYYRRLSSIPTDAPAFVLVKHILSSVKKLPVDAAGKILIPRPLREYADIRENGIFCIGKHSYELWSYERLEAKRTADLSRADAYKSFEIYLADGVNPSDVESLEEARKRIEAENRVREIMNMRDELNGGGHTEDE